MAKLTNDSNNQTYIYHQFNRSGCRNVTHCTVNNNSSFQNYTYPDDHIQQTSDSPWVQTIYRKTTMLGLADASLPW